MNTFQNWHRRHSRASQRRLSDSPLSVDVRPQGNIVITVQDEDGNELTIFAETDHLKKFAVQLTSAIEKVSNGK